MQLNQQVVLVTGTGAGPGRVRAGFLASQRAEVVPLDVEAPGRYIGTGPDAAQLARADWASMGGRYGEIVPQSAQAQSAQELKAAQSSHEPMEV